MSILGQIFGTTTDKSADETLAYNAMLAASGSAAAYLAATLDATTPEVRRLFSEYTTQSVMAQEALAELCLKKGWINPYETPTKQMQTTVSQSASVIGTAQQ